MFILQIKLKILREDRDENGRTIDEQGVEFFVTLQRGSIDKNPDPTSRQSVVLNHDYSAMVSCCLRTLVLSTLFFWNCFDCSSDQHSAIHIFLLMIVLQVPIRMLEGYRRVSVEVDTANEAVIKRFY